jgi:hypothetical protein
MTVAFTWARGLRRKVSPAALKSFFVLAGIIVPDAREISGCSRRNINAIFTQHALQRMAKRQLQREWVHRVIASLARIEPDEIDATLEHRLGIVPELANRVLRVIVSRDEPKRVITVHLDRKMKGYS